MLSQNPCSQRSSSSTDKRLTRFLVNSNAEKKIAFTTQERPIETPRPGIVSAMSVDWDWRAWRTSIHSWIHELNFWSCRRVFPTDEAVSLVHTLRCINRKYLNNHEKLPPHFAIIQLTHAQLTSPHNPPAVTTAKGVVGELPRAFAKSCFALSYVMK